MHEYRGDIPGEMNWRKDEKPLGDIHDGIWKSLSCLKGSPAKPVGNSPHEIDFQS